MKAIVINEYGKKEVLKEKEMPIPSPLENQVVVNMKAISINPLDWNIREGYTKDFLKWDFPIILGSDISGVITEIGSDVSGFQVGDEVFAAATLTPSGTYAEYVALDSAVLALKPSNLSFNEAASVPVAALTAWQALFDLANLKKGEKVLIHAGAGGVGSLAIQLAKNVNAHVTTTASPQNHKFLKDLGADEVIDYKTQDITELLSDMDVVFDTIGGETQVKSIEVLKKDTGRLVTAHTLVAEEAAKEKGIDTKSVWLQTNGEELQAIAKLLADGKVKPVVGEVIPFSEKGLQEAHALSQTHHAVGKIVIEAK